MSPAAATRHTLERRALRRGHDLGDGQRAARLPDRPVPDPRARHEREDAVDRAADAGWRAVRDGRGRLGTEARAAARRGEPPCAGIRSGSSSRSPSRSSTSRRSPTTRAPRCWRRRSTRATGRLLAENRSPSRRVGELDNRGSHFYLALYWAEALAAQGEDEALAAHFAPLAKGLADEEETILGELNAVQGSPVDIGGYYHPDIDRCVAVIAPERDAEPHARRVLERRLRARRRPGGGSGAARGGPGAARERPGSGPGAAARGGSGQLGAARGPLGARGRTGPDARDAPLVSPVGRPDAGSARVRSRTRARGSRRARRSTRVCPRGRGGCPSCGTRPAVRGASAARAP